MTNSLSKLQTAQLALAERINSIFAQSFNNYLGQQQLKTRKEGETK
jgi:hypothetical protein